MILRQSRAIGLMTNSADYRSMIGEIGLGALMKEQQASADDVIGVRDIEPGPEV